MAHYTTREKSMKNTGNNNKIIAVLLAVIALCMVCLVFMVTLLFVNKSGNNALSNTGTEIAEEYPVDAGNEVSEEIVDDDANSVITTTQGTGYNPFYKYEGELSEFPITPTKVENADLLDNIKYRYADKNQFEEDKTALIDHILDAASKHEVYANPTIVADSIMWAPDLGIIVDLHTKNNDFLTILENDIPVIEYRAETSERTSRVFSLNDKMSAPVMYGPQNNIYVFNRGDFYNYLLTKYNTSEEAEQKTEKYEKLIMETSLGMIKYYKDTGIHGEEIILTEEELATIRFGYLSMFNVWLNDDGSLKYLLYSLEMKGANGLTVTVAAVIDEEQNIRGKNGEVCFEYIPTT